MIYLAERSSTDLSKSTFLWNKLSNNWRAAIYTPLLLRAEQEKILIARYEIEQMQLDWQRMKFHADITFNDLDVCLKTILSV